MFVNVDQQLGTRWERIANHVDVLEFFPDRYEREVALAELKRAGFYVGRMHLYGSVAVPVVRLTVDKD